MTKAFYISCNANVLGGQPVITGTRIPAQRVSELVKQGYNERNLKKEFGNISLTTLRGVLYELTALGLEHLTEPHESRKAHA